MFIHRQAVFVAVLGTIIVGVSAVHAAEPIGRTKSFEITQKRMRNALGAIADGLLEDLGENKKRASAVIVPERKQKDGGRTGMVGLFLSGPASHLARHCVFFSDSLVRLKRVRNLLELPPEELEAGRAPDRRPRFRQSLSFENVGFSYPDGAPVLRDASFRIGAGEKVAVVGPSGSGKTTAAYLMLRLFEPAAGAILLDGEDARRFPLGAYRELFGFVPQETVLCDGTIRENILLGNPDASDGEVEAACRAAQAHDFIRALPGGYDTSVGQNGFHFSGGQRQRLGIARALLRKSRVLIMDEPTSFLDPGTEKRLIAGLRSFLGAEATLVLITHRPSVSRMMDRILATAGGDLIERLPEKRGPLVASLMGAR